MQPCIDATALGDAVEHLAQGAVDRTYTEVKHGLDCRLRLLQQNRVCEKATQGSFRSRRQSSSPSVELLK